MEYFFIAALFLAAIACITVVVLSEIRRRKSELSEARARNLPFETLDEVNNLILILEDLSEQVSQKAAEWDTAEIQKNRLTKEHKIAIAQLNKITARHHTILQSILRPKLPNAQKQLADLEEELASPPIATKAGSGSKAA